MYIIKINDETKKDKCWIGHSNASDSSGFYLTRETTAKIFVDEVNDIPKLKDWLEKKTIPILWFRLRTRRTEEFIELL